MIAELRLFARILETLALTSYSPSVGIHVVRTNSSFDRHARYVCRELLPNHCLNDYVLSTRRSSSRSRKYPEATHVIRKRCSWVARWFPSTSPQLRFVRHADAEIYTGLGA